MTPLAHIAALLRLPSVGAVVHMTAKKAKTVQAKDIPAFTVSHRWKIQSPPCLVNSSTANRLLGSAGLIEKQAPTAPPVSLMKLQVEFSLVPSGDSF